MITGGTGSFGSTILGHFLSQPVAEIRIVSRDEKKQDDQRKRFRDPRLRYYIADVRDARTLDMITRGVDYIYHAAALKQVPSCEFHPMEAVATNVIGTSNVIDAAIRNNVQRVVCLSTDKADPRSRGRADVASCAPGPHRPMLSSHRAGWSAGVQSPGIG